jgi:hypothetical protein
MKDEAKLPAFYSMRALGELGNVSWYMLHKPLRKCGVRRVRAGPNILIPAAELAEKIPMLCRSLQLVESSGRRRDQRKWRA